MKKKNTTTFDRNAWAREYRKRHRRQLLQNEHNYRLRKKYEEMDNQELIEQQEKVDGKLSDEG